MASPEDEGWLKLLSGASKKGLDVCGYVDGRDSCNNFLENYFSITHSTFCCRQSCKDFFTEAKDKFSRKQVMWQQVQGSITIAFDGTPFVVHGRTRVLTCQHGLPRQCSPSDNSEKGTAKGRKYVSFHVGKKDHCHAVIKIVRADRLTEFSIEGGDLSAKAGRRDKEGATARLMAAATQNNSGRPQWPPLGRHWIRCGSSEPTCSSCFSTEYPRACVCRCP